MNPEIRLKIIKSFGECFQKIIKRNDLMSYLEQNHLLDGNLIFACNGKLIDVANTMETNITCTTEELFNTEFSIEVKIFIDRTINLNIKSINKVSELIEELQSKLGINSEFMEVYVKDQSFSRKCYILELCKKSVEVKFSRFDRRFSDFFIYSVEHPVGKFSMKNKYNY